MELLKGATGMQMEAIPHNGSFFAVTAIVGEVDAALGSVLDVLPLIQAGELPAVAMGGTESIAATRV